MDQLRQQKAVRQMSRDAARNSVLLTQRQQKSKKDTIAYRWQNTPEMQKHMGQRNDMVMKRSPRKKSTLTTVIVIAVICSAIVLLKQLGLL